MELNIKEPENIEKLKKMIKDNNLALDEFSIRIENNIFSIDGNWLLKSTNGTTNRELENINVWLEDNGGIKSFRSELRKATESFEGRMDIDIKKLLYARIERTNSQKEKPCLTLSYLSILETGNAVDIKKWKDYGFIWQDLKKISRTKLTPNTNYTYGVIRQKEQEIKNLLQTYTKFNEADFKKYFLYGMENKQTLLEGIMYYTNRDLTDKYLELREGETFPTQEEKIEIWKKKTAKNYEQLYRFINLLDGQDSRFDYHLKPEEKEEVNEMVENTLEGLLDENVILFFNRGIFFNDRTNDEARTKGITFDKVRGYIWVEEVYKVIQQLEYMERTDRYQYYSRWLQAKISRLEISNQYSKESLEELKKIYSKYFDEKRKRENEIEK